MPLDLVVSSRAPSDVATVTTPSTTSTSPAPQLLPHPGYGIAPFEPDKLRHAETATVWGLSRWAEFERGEVPRPY